jgi:beta-mannanase
MNWTHDWDARLLASFKSSGRIPLISWQSHDRPVSEIATGRHDGYIRSWARGAREYGAPVYLRPFPEMNGDWTGWNGDPEALVAAWQRIVTLFRAEGASNVRWVWSPNVSDEPRIAENRMELYYPGADYVDVLALDGFNWGDVRPWIGWRSFEEVFQAGYARVTALGDQPVWFAETASAEAGGDKAAWVVDMFTSQAFPRLDAIIWFNENKETDWRVASSRRSLASFQEILPQLGREVARLPEAAGTQSH